MAESVDALVSNTSGATRAGSTPALGTQETGEQIFLFACFFFLQWCRQSSCPYQDVDGVLCRSRECLYHRQRMAVDFSIKVESIDVCHSRNVIKHCHDAFVQGGGSQLVLMGDLVQKQATVSFFG